VDPPQTVQADGDYVGMTPVEITSRPQALRVVVPK
jgi:diacylglycerol kinase family enzyme